MKGADYLKQQFLKYKIVEKGEFTLKSGEKSDTYVDLRKLISYPNILKSVCREIEKKINNKDFDSIMGVPTGGYSFAQTCSLSTHKPCLFLRKEAKEHGKKKLIEGIWKKGDKIILIEDVITTGGSLIETIELVEGLGLVIEKIIVVLKRKEDGINKIKNMNINIDHLFTLQELQELGTTTSKTEVFKNIYINSFTNRFIQIVQQKQSNIVLSPDFTNTNEILNIVNTCGPHICGVKLHLDIIADFTQQFMIQLKDLSRKYNFIIIEDRKFADIGNTIEKQLTNPHYNMIEYVDAVTTHSVSGSNIFDVFKKHNIPVIVIQDMSSSNNLMSYDYIEETLVFANENKEIILGVVGQQKYKKDFLLFTPGININETADNLGQNYKNPRDAKNKGSDIFIIGRGICNSTNPLKEIVKYKTFCWN
jgi:uridine monophosphate synthetase